MMNKKPGVSFTVAASYVKGLLTAFQVIGLDTKELSCFAGITEEQLGVPESRISLEQLEAIWQHAIDLSDDEHIGLKVGREMPTGHWGLVEMLATNSQYLGEALNASLQYWRLISDTGKQFKLIETHDCVTLTFWSPFFNIPQANEADMVYFEKRLNLLLGSDIKPLRYQFGHSKHGSLTDQDYQIYLSAPIEFEASTNSITLPKSALSKQIIASNSELKLVIEAIAERQIKSLSEAVTTTQKVSVLIQNGAYSLEQVASSLCMSERSLQRKLQQENARFKDMVSDAKKNKAEIYLKSREYSFQEISFLLGYKDERAFYDAVKRWYGMSPTQVVEQLGRVSPLEKTNKGEKTN